MGGKSPLPREKHQQIDVDQNLNKSDFQSSVTLTKTFGCFRDTFGSVQGLPGPQMGGGNLLFGLSMHSTP